jgi:hypothetical protein
VQQHDRKSGARNDDVQRYALELEGVVFRRKRGNLALFPEICSDPFSCRSCC